jgi:septal ring factor EnvC (AmiA/AmiB activator)
LNRDTNRTLSYVAWVVLAIAITVLIILNFQIFSRINGDNSRISALEDQTASLQKQLSLADSQITTIGTNNSNLMSQLVANGSQISSLSSQLSAANSQIASISRQISNSGSGIGTLTDQVSALTSQISKMQTQLAATMDNITSLQNQLNSQQTTLNTITTPVKLFSSLNVIQGSNTKTELITFTPAFSGYVSIGGISNSATSYISIVNNSTGSSNSFSFGTGTTIYTPLSGGVSYTIYFGNTDSSGTITANLLGTYQL